MVKFGKSRPAKQTEEIRTDDRRGAEEKPVWYKTWWGVLCAIIVILFLFLSVLGKPKWIQIEVSNVFVAFVAVGFTYLFLRVLRVGSIILKVFFGLLWLLFLPNTAYLFTDLGHIGYQWSNTVSLSGRMLLIVQYLLLELFGIIMFLFSFLPFEKITDRVSLFERGKVTWLIFFNFLVAYGMVLGRFQHINSWVVFTNPLKVLELALNIFLSFDLLSLVILFGLLCNFIYFLIRRLLLQRIEKYISDL
ncbi:DUF1361 domain-containing protein [Desulfosporosinus sp. SYSU MS00001]|uniref:DUF1361 domain-containing protein n=1 Tax=Desulfosporosinus sp. SYSU MS00001 TaxID=3416284 RepID=UPI003CF1251B